MDVMQDDDLAEQTPQMDMLKALKDHKKIQDIKEKK
jgi:hypothetical protein